MWGFGILIDFGGRLSRCLDLSLPPPQLLSVWAWTQAELLVGRIPESSVPWAWWQAPLPIPGFDVNDYLFRCCISQGNTCWGLYCSCPTPPFKVLQFSRFSLFPCTCWLGRRDVLSYFTQTQNIYYANGTRFLANKWLLPRQWLFLHFHKHSPYFFQFPKFAECVHLLHSDMPIQINLFNFFFSRKLLKNPESLA